MKNLVDRGMEKLQGDTGITIDQALSDLFRVPGPQGLMRGTFQIIMT